MYVHDGFADVADRELRGPTCYGELARPECPLSNDPRFLGTFSKIEWAVCLVSAWLVSIEHRPGAALT